MKKIGFTLIELMIVVAVLGITCTYFIAPINQLHHWLKTDDAEMVRQQKLTEAFMLVRTAFYDSSFVEITGPDELKLSGGKWRRILRLKSGEGIRVETAGGGRQVVFDGAMRFSAFQFLDAKTVWCQTQIDSARLPMVWRCGK